MRLLAATILGANATSIDISGLAVARAEVLSPALASEVSDTLGTYRHLQVVAMLRSARTGNSSDQGNLRFNNDTGANYYTQAVFAAGAVEDGSENIATTSIAMNWNAATSPADYFTALTAIIPNYASSTMRKAITAQCVRLAAESTGQVLMSSFGAFWDSVAAIDRLTFFASNGDVLAGSQVSIYGIA